MSNLCRGSLEVLLDMRNLHLLSGSFLPSWPKTALLPSHSHTREHRTTWGGSPGAFLVTELPIFMAGFSRRRGSRRIFIDRRDSRSYVCVCDLQCKSCHKRDATAGHTRCTVIVQAGSVGLENILVCRRRGDKARTKRSRHNGTHIVCCSATPLYSSHITLALAMECRGLPHEALRL